MIKFKRLSVLFCFLFMSCEALNKNITKGVTIRDGETLISSNNRFELGFFSIQDDNSSSRYVGIRYHEIEDKAVVWIANRDDPILDKNGSLTIAEDGNLMVKDGSNVSVWASGVQIAVNDSVVAVLEASGNLKLSGGGGDGEVYWQSFDHPMDTFLPDMRIPVENAQNSVFVSWRSDTDPSKGNFSMRVDPQGAPQIVIWEGGKRRWRTGHWNNQIFIGVPTMLTLTNFQYGFKVSRGNDGRLYVTYNPVNVSDLLMFRITWDGFEEQKKWNESEMKWEVMQKQPDNDCERYNYCGNFTVCTKGSEGARCDCLDGHDPVNRNEWSSGCRRRAALKCQRNGSAAAGGEDGFKQLRCLKLPDFADVHTGLASDGCQWTCLSNCSCNAFAFVNGIGCMTWSGDLIDVQSFDKAGSTLHLRLAYSEFEGRQGLSTAVIIVIVLAGVIFFAIAIWLLWWKFRKSLKGSSKMNEVSALKRKSDTPISDMSKSKEYSTDISGPADLVLDGSQVNGPNLPLLNFNVVAAATNDFAMANKLGRGGFGDVYKGKLPGGEDVAVKRLSKISGQGLEEFKNEIILIAKLQHRNLVRLLGCCIQGDEKLLIYEYMPNRSLDFFLFNPENQKLLDWGKRFAIIEGIARGLLYLHRDSRLRIIHRDLKASNILLDEQMNPKISDFGMARIFGGNQNEANTNRVVGTYGYMSPEYAMEGLFSVKSDVYSFGILLLEIISGRRNISFRTTDQLSLVAYAWQLWDEGNAMDLVDQSMRDSCCQSDVIRCIHVAFLCVQDSAVHRPAMDKVLLMLETETSTSSSLPLPSPPTFTSIRNSTDIDLNMDGPDTVSSNDLTFTTVSGR